MLSVALLEIKNPGNLGSIARLMKNFNLKDLILINPMCSKDDIDALVRSKQGESILRNAKTAEFSHLENFNQVIGTTSRLGTDYNIPRLPLTPDKVRLKRNSILLLGREDSGLTNREIQECDIIVTIPSSKSYPVLNISHAAAILFYELFKDKANITSHIKSADKSEIQALLKLIDSSLDKLPFPTREKKETQKKVWKNIINKSNPTKRELSALCGFFKKIK